MIPTVQNVYDLARFHVGDTVISTGQIFTGPYKQTRQGRGAYTRQALYVAGAQAPVVSQQTP